jgi:shikimate dehydrogenase
MGEGKVLLGLIGFPLGHSRSPEWFHAKFIREGLKNAAYRLFPIASAEEFPKLLQDNPDLSGLNVTIPYKQLIIPFLDDLDETARTIGAVNTIKITRRQGAISTRGYNTDAPGFLKTLTGTVLHGPALILGTGGGARAVAYALQRMSIPYEFVSRAVKGNGIISYHDLSPDLIRTHLLIINTTPVGMLPETGNAPPIPYQFLTGDHVLYDLIYNPEETEFLKRGKAMNALTMNGKQMLLNQAELSYDIFLGEG